MSSLKKLLNWLQGSLVSRDKHPKIGVEHIITLDRTEPQLTLRGMVEDLAAEFWPRVATVWGTEI